MATNINPSSRSFGHSICGDAMDILVWRYDLPQFFEDITGDPPYPDQTDFLKEQEDITPGKVLLSAGRQLGKSRAISVIALWYAYVLPLSPDVGHPIKVLILGGSFAQAKLTYEYVCEYVLKIPWLKSQLKTMPTYSPMGAEMEFLDGSSIRALTASGKQVRGPHADLLIVDEAAEAEEDVLKASFQTTIASPIGKAILASTPHQARKSSYLFIDYFRKPQIYGFKKVYKWSAKDCPNPNIQREYQQALKYMDEGTRSIEYEGNPYIFAGKVFPLKQLRDCSQFKNLVPDPNGNERFAGVDWGFCYPGMNQVLTIDGWKRMDSLHGNETILTWKNGILQYQPILKYGKRRSIRNCHSWENRNLSLFGTWGHAIPVLDRYEKSFHEHRIGDNITHHYLIRKGRYHGNMPSLLFGFNPSDFMELLGWYLSEGSSEVSSKGYRISIAQKDGHKKQEIFNLLMKMNLNPHITKSSIRFNHKYLATYFKALGKSHTKFIPRFFKNLDAFLLERMFKTMMEGDGDSDGFRYNTYSKQLADDFQELVIKIGKHISYIEDRQKKGYRVHLLNTGSTPNRKHHTIKPYIGYFVSLEVPSGYVLIRNKTKPFIGHNSPAPTCLVIVQRITDKYRILYTDAYLQENFEDVLEKIEKICKSYQVLRVNTDSEDIGENQRLNARGLNVHPIPFKSQKSWMRGYLRALVENLKLEIDDERDDRLKQQMLAYSYETKRDDDFVDALMLAVKEGMRELKGERDPQEITKLLQELNEPIEASPVPFTYDSRYFKPDEITTDEERKKWEEEREAKRKARTFLMEGCECGSKEFINDGFYIRCKSCSKIIGENK